MITEEIRAEKQSAIEFCYKTGLEALQAYSELSGAAKERAYSDFINQRCNLIAMQKAFNHLDDDLADYCCTLGLDLGDQLEAILDKELAA